MKGDRQRKILVRQCTLYRQIVSNWNCCWSNYKVCLEKKQVRQVFSVRAMTKIQLVLVSSSYQGGCGWARYLCKSQGC
jgi:hypothetical protein